MVGAGRDDDDAVDAARAQRADQFLLAAAVLVAAAGEDEDAALARAILDGAVQRRHERVGDVLEHEADRRRLAVEAAEARGVDVAAVVEPLDGGLDAGLHRRADARLPVDDARDGGEGDAGERRDVVHRRRLRVARCPVRHEVFGNVFS